MLRVITREQVIRVLQLEDIADDLSNAKLEELYYDAKGLPTIIGSLCPITKDKVRYTLVMSNTQLPLDMQTAILDLPDELKPKFVMRNPATEQVTIEQSIFYMFLKKVVSGNYEGKNPEKTMKLMEQSKILRTNIGTDKIEDELVVVFPKNTKRVTDRFLSAFVEQEIKTIKVVKNGKVIKEVKHDVEY